MEKENKSVVPFKLHEGYKAGESEVITFIDINSLKESKTNPRKVYDDKALNDLADSIKIKGIVQNLVVRKVETINHEGFEIVAGSRRFRAAKIAGLKAVPCVVRTYTDGEVLEIQVIENNQREDVHPLEEGEGYAALLKLEGYTVEAIAAKIGRSDKYVRERLQLAQLCPRAKELYQKDILKYTHCRILARLTSDQQENAIKDIVREDYLTSGKHSLAVKSLEYWVESNIEKKLGSASFPLDDKSLNKEMGACIGCRKNTASDGQLFPEYASKASKGVCLKPECYLEKVKVYAERLIKEKLKSSENEEFLLLSDKRHSNYFKKYPSGDKLVIGYGNYDIVNKGTAGAKQGMKIAASDMKEKGKTIYVKLKNKKDSKPGKDEVRRSSNNGSGEMSPEQKAEHDRLSDKAGFIDSQVYLLILEKGFKLRDKKLFKKILINEIDSAIDNIWEDEVQDGIRRWIYKVDEVGLQNIQTRHGHSVAMENGLKRFNDDELFKIFLIIGCMGGNAEKAAKDLKLNWKEIEKEAEKLAEEKFPDPSKQLIVTFDGMKYGLKENDYLTELQAISQLLRKYIDKEKPQEMKSMNLINPGAGQPNVFFRKDAKTGLYKFSEWIDKDGTAMGFDRMSKKKFIKCIKGFKAVKKEEPKKK